MKYFIFIIVFTVLISKTYGQVIDSSVAPMDISIALSCETDTSISFYTEKEFSWIDSVGGSSVYEFLEGDGTYLEISIEKKCNTGHGFSHEIIVVQINPNDSTDIVKLDARNTIWLIRASWRYDPFIANFSGTLDFKNHTLEFEPKIDLNRNILVDGKIIKSILLTKPELY